MGAMTVNDAILDIVTVCHKFWFPYASARLLCFIPPAKCSLCPTILRYWAASSRKQPLLCDYFL